MSALTWKHILHSQQKDFIKRLKYRDLLPEGFDDLILFSTLTAIEEFNLGEQGYNNEIIVLSFGEQHETQINYFGDRLVNKYYDRDSDDNPEDLQINNKIGKIGEEAVKIYLGSLVSEVDYHIYNGGDKGTDFYLEKNSSIKIQVKTKSLKRLTCKKFDKENYRDRRLLYEDLFLPEYLEIIQEMKWEINFKESNINQILICVVLLTPIAMNSFTKHYYTCLIADFILIEKTYSFQSFKMNELLYMGGLKAYLKSL